MESSHPTAARYRLPVTMSGAEAGLVPTLQNGFGAMIRSNYTCEVRDDGNDMWSLVSLTGLE